jgi:hypothetical protein
MTSRPAKTEASPAEDATALRALFESKARAELIAADALAPGSDRVAWRGELLAHVALVKGLPGPAEASGDAALSGPDGDAADKALAALGYAPEGAFRMLSRPEPGLEPAPAAERLRLAIEAVDPELVIALDAAAAEDLALAFGIEPLRFGEVRIVLGRRLLAVDGLEASLSDEKRKAQVWRQLLAGKAPGPVY